MNWLLLVLVAPIFFVAYQALSKLLPKDISIFLVTAYALLAGAVVMLLLHMLSTSAPSVTIGNTPLLIVAGMGVLIALGNYAIIKAFSLGIPQSLFAATFNPLYIVYGVLVGILVWNEKLTMLQIVGIALATVGILLIVQFRTSLP